MIALAAVAAFAFYNSGRFFQPKPPQSPARADFKIPNEPDTTRLISARAALSLNSNQIAALGVILADWQKQSAPPIAKMRKAYADMNEFLGSPPKKPPAMREIMLRAGPLSDATSEYIKIRDSFQARATAVLTPDQKALWKKVKKEKEVRRNEK